eukprot:TRINITY_DN1073_c0_g1_i2.p1 TRINITY_DN1073_c0_g1~~TRINITY_DN1073_c0_g1_i2.p1  ORF type:complete len:279 (+),score=44.26 TRINITY_DN1073_c0_g1_i2:464-1300(+)
MFEAELCFNYHYNQYCLMVTDIMICEGEGVHEQPLEKRMALISQAIVQPFRETYTEDKYSEIPFFLLGKMYYRTTHLPSLLKHVTHFEEPEEPSGSRYLYENGKRYNDNIGLVFLPDDAPFNSSSVREWKWSELTTAIFKVQINEDNCSVFCKDLTGQELQYRNIEFSKTCLQSMKENSASSSAIVECSYHPNSGNWIYYKHSKRSPDTFEKIFEVLESIAHNLTKEVLIDGFAVRNADVVYQTPEEMSPEIVSSVKRSHSAAFGSDYHNVSPKRVRY